ncbi:MAG: nitroreductase family protein [Planctomycetaceae bacterium]|nr:nitroreductase family protein [Planctomycetaceae bacterium]
MTAQLPVSQFRADPGKCVACGMCVLDCPTHIIDIADCVARVVPEKDPECLRCLHCLAVCPYGAVSAAGVDPEDTEAVTPFDPDSLRNLILARRSVRQFGAGTVDEETFRRILAVVREAPTGVNVRHRRFTAILDPKVLAELRDKVAHALVATPEKLPPEQSWLVDIAREWLDDGVDGIFRNAPHLLVVTAGPEGICKVPDCIIALSYFDLYAQANGIGTTWCGMVEAVLRYLPESRRWLGVPPDHEIGYAMLFGPAGVTYRRTVRHDDEDVLVLDRLEE